MKTLVVLYGANALLFFGTTEVPNIIGQMGLFLTAFIINIPCSRGVSGALYLQSATAGVMSIRGAHYVRLPSISGVDNLVLRNRHL